MANRCRDIGIGEVISNLATDVLRNPVWAYPAQEGFIEDGCVPHETKTVFNEKKLTLVGHGKTIEISDVDRRVSSVFTIVQCRHRHIHVKRINGLGIVVKHLLGRCP